MTSLDRACAPRPLGRPRRPLPCARDRALSDSASRAARSLHTDPARPSPSLPRCPRAECQTPRHRHVHRQVRNRNTRRRPHEPNEYEPKTTALSRCRTCAFHQPRSYSVGRPSGSHLRGVAAALPRVWRPHEDRLLHHRSARRHRHPAPPRAPAHTSPHLTRSRSAAGGLPPRPDSGLRSLRGRTRPRVRIRPGSAPRVRRLTRLVPLPSRAASAFRPPRSAHLNIPASQSIIRLSTTTQSASSIRTTSPPLPPLPITQQHAPRLFTPKGG